MPRRRYDGLEYKHLKRHVDTGSEPVLGTPTDKKSKKSGGARWKQFSMLFGVAELVAELQDVLQMDTTLWRTRWTTSSSGLASCLPRRRATS